MRLKEINRQAMHYAIAAMGVLSAPEIIADTLNTAIPKQQEESFSVPINVDIPKQPLATSLHALGKAAGMSISFPNDLVSGKTAPEVRGRMSRKEALQRLLDTSGLVPKIEGENVYIQKAPPKVEDKSVNVDKVEVRAKRFYEIGPLGGTGLTKEEIPGNVQSLTAQDIKEAHALSLTDLMNSKLQSVNVNDYQGNPFQMDVQYRGFTAGPQIGTPQGLSAFIDGIRINEPFGDVVNWDMIPLNALASFDVFPGSNPIFGLGTLGGALSMKTKDGFNHSGFNADVLTGSFGRKQLQVDGGWNNGTVGLFAAGNFFLEDGWRENSPSRVNQLFTKASYRGEKLDLNLGVLNVWNDLVGNGLIPTEMYAQDRNGVYTSPDTTKNKLLQFQLSGSYFVNDTFSVTAQAYRRKSNRNQYGADVYTQYGAQTVKRNLRANEQYTCLFDSTTATNSYGLPDYYVLDLDTDVNDPFANQDFLAFITGSPPANSFNRKLPDEAAAFLAGAQNNFNGAFKNAQQALIFKAQNGTDATAQVGNTETWSNGEPSWQYDPSTFIQYRLFVGDPVSQAFLAKTSFYYFTDDGVKHLVVPVTPNNAADCAAYKSGPDGTDITGLKPLQVPYGNGEPTYVDGAAQAGGQAPGVVEGTPTSVLTNTQIDQITDGASVQLNWNFEKHKLMVGASIDMPSADYTSSQMLGLLDANRKAYLAPDEIRDQYALADQPISNNNFEGSQVTKSLYISETWSPVETLHFTGSARYNTTKGQNKIASRTFGFTVFDLSQFEAFPDEYGLCINGVCPTTGYVVPDASNVLNAPEKEKFSYQSLNPSLGVSWQAKEDLNIYANISQGTRVPSVIELGCAFDPTPVAIGSGQFLARSLAQNRSCSLPTTLSGDPYLPQIKATSIDIGLRGRWGDNVEWNLGAYRTDLRDDIYLVTYPGNRSFFNTIGDTRRQGVEAGMTASLDKWKLRLNYSLTSATFENSFKMAANDNSSSVETVTGNNDFGRQIQVNPGDIMPGVPLHNLNATVSYAVTPNWQVGFTAVAHSMAYVRGNENNKHQTGVTLVDSYEEPNTGTVIPVTRAPTTSPGFVPGYMTFNFQTSYKINSEWTLGFRVNNIFDKEYFSAGRLGRNPFSPSIYGAIGPDGYNHNSSDWQTTNFIAPGAPRGAWLSLTYQFDPNK